MKAHRIIYHIVFSLIISLFISTISPGKASAEMTVKANHDDIKIDFFYHGSTVSVAGVTDPGTDLIIKIASAEGHEVLKQKGKVAGFLWMNTGTLNFEKTPNLYSIYSTKNIDDILSTDDMDKYVIGYPALSRHVEIAPISNEDERSKWFNEFVKYKESSNLYKTSSGKILISDKDGRQAYYILTAWPYQAPPGDYVVTVYAVKDNKVIETKEAKVLVEQVGIIKMLAGMAKNNGALYGLISIMSALAAGFGVGLIFKKSGGAH
ncbi:MAG: TIGR02186 family protein [Thermodesulfovibrionia bacterium]|nr:TIGR02186 family protein [Thermodesulfovibrionia bacterium]